METSSYSAQQRRAINLVWTASGDYQFEPQFLALKSNGEPDFYMNCVRSEEHTSELQSLKRISYAVSLDRKSTRLNSSH